MSSSVPPGPLAGITVIEFSQVVAGPFCGLVLADLGARVVKVEPLDGDPYRNQGAVVPDQGKRFQSLNRGKSSIAVDLQTAAGQRAVQRLAKLADVVVINYRSGVAKRLGIDYATLSADNPGLVYCRITGFGVHSAAAEWPATDPMMQAYSGLMVAGGKVGDDGLPQPGLAAPVADYMSGIGSVAAICAALYHRGNGGPGQLIDSSLLRSALTVQDTNVMREPVSDAVIREPVVQALAEIRQRGGSYRELVDTRNDLRMPRHTFRLYSGTYQAKDGVIMLGALTPHSRACARRVLNVTNDPTERPGVVLESAGAIAEFELLLQHIRDVIREKTVAEWLTAFQAGGVPVAPVNFPEFMADDPVVHAESIMWDVVNDVTGPQRVVGPLFEMSVTPTAVQGAAPRLGGQTRQLLLEAGLEAEEVEELVNERIVRVVD